MIYLDNAATSGFRPDIVYETLIRTAKQCVNPLRSQGSEGFESLLNITAVREGLKSYFKMKNATAVFTPGCTYALNLAILGSHKGGRVVTTVMEHNSVLRPLVRLRKQGTEIVYLEPNESGGISTDSFERAIVGAEMAVVTHISNVTGGINDVERMAKIARRQGVLFIVDCAQSAGHLDFDASHIDMLAIPAHKGLLGVAGVGALLINTKTLPVPLIIGGSGSMSEREEMPPYPPERYEAGTQNYSGICALGAALKWQATYKAKISKRAKMLTDYLTQEIAEIQEVQLYSFPNESGIVSFGHRSIDSTQFCSTLANDYGIISRGGLHCAPLLHRYLGTQEGGLVRISVSGFNTQNDIDRAVWAVKRTIKGSI